MRRRRSRFVRSPRCTTDCRRRQARRTRSSVRPCSSRVCLRRMAADWCTGAGRSLPWATRGTWGRTASRKGTHPRRRPARSGSGRRRRETARIPGSRCRRLSRNWQRRLPSSRPTTRPSRFHPRQPWRLRCLKKTTVRRARSPERRTAVRRPSAAGRRSGGTRMRRNRRQHRSHRRTPCPRGSGPVRCRRRSMNHMRLRGRPPRTRLRSGSHALLTPTSASSAAGKDASRRPTRGVQMGEGLAWLAPRHARRWRQLMAHRGKRWLHRGLGS
jgi:hypothetical protein